MSKKWDLNALVARVVSDLDRDLSNEAIRATLVAAVLEVYEHLQCEWDRAAYILVQAGQDYAARVAHSSKAYFKLGLPL